MDRALCFVALQTLFYRRSAGYCASELAREARKGEAVYGKNGG
jgi:hypothetical protein